MSLPFINLNESYLLSSIHKQLYQFYYYIDKKDIKGALFNCKEYTITNLAHPYIQGTCNAFQFLFPQVKVHC